MSHEERIALQGLKLREQREIHRYAEQSSVLLQFAKRNHFKYLYETVIENIAQGQTFEQTLSMQLHGASVESFLSPSGWILRRAGCDADGSKMQTTAQS